MGETEVPFIENDRVLGNLNERFGGNYLHEATLISIAATHGYNTAAVGKAGPILIQDIPEASPSHGLVPVPKTVIIDDLTGKSGGITKLSYEKVGDTWYFDSAGFNGRTVGLPAGNK